MRIPVLIPQTDVGLVLFYGHRTSLSLATFTAARLLLTPQGPQGLVVVDGGNAFDPYLVSDVAREAGEPPERWLAHVTVARAFTAHQLEVLVVERLPAVSSGRLILLLGLLDLFYDEAIPSTEARRVLRRILGTLERLIHRRSFILAACPTSSERSSREAMLLPPLRRLASWVFHVQPEEIVMEKGGDFGGADVAYHDPARL